MGEDGAYALFCATVDAASAGSAIGRCWSESSGPSVCTR
jgi:hypothetical protein